MNKNQLDINDDIDIIITDSNFSIRADMQKPALFKLGDRLKVQLNGDGKLPKLSISDPIDEEICLPIETLDEPRPILKQLTNESQFYSFAVAAKIPHLPPEDDIGRWKIDIYRQSVPSAFMRDANNPNVVVQFFFYSLDRDKNGGKHSRGGDGNGGGVQRLR